MRSSLVLAGMALALITLLPGALTADAAAKGSMALQQRHEIEHECERLVYTFHRLFESEHSKVADLFAEDGKMQFGDAEPVVGADTIREAYLVVEERAVVELNALIVNNLLIDVVDENNATGFSYVTHYQHRYKDAKREGTAYLNDPPSLLVWTYEFKRVNGEWKFSSHKVEAGFIREPSTGSAPE